MKRTNAKKLPQIAVEEEAVAVRLGLPAELNAELEQYGHYFAEASGRKPLTLGHVIVGLVQSYLDDSAAFQKWRNEHRNGAEPKGSPFATPTTARGAAKE